MDSNLARNALHQYLHLMIGIQQSSSAISEIGFASPFNNFLLSNAYSLKDLPELVAGLHVMLDPARAAKIVQNRIDPKCCTWVEISKNADALQHETLKTSYVLHRTWRTDVIPTSVLRGFSVTWKSAVIEAIIWNRGAPRVRSAAQAHVYRMSRCDLHNHKAHVYEMKQNKKPLYEIYKGLSVA